MTKQERQQLRRAIELIMTDDGWDEGFRILIKLADLRYPAHDVMDNARSVPITEVAGISDQVFSVKERE